MCASPEPLVRLFPATGWAAGRAGETIPYITWCAFASLDSAGSGKVAKDEAREFIAAWRTIDPASVRRILREGEAKGYWSTGRTRDGVERLFLTGIAMLMVRLGVEQERAPRLVPLARLRTVAMMRGQLYAAVHELPGHSGKLHNAPLSRAVKATLTGASRATQKRYDQRSTVLVQTMVAEIETDDPVHPRGHGFFTGPGGVLYRRLPDLRVPADQAHSSRSAARHATSKAAVLREAHPGSGPGCEPPVSSLRGQGESRPLPAPFSRNFFVAVHEDQAIKLARDYDREHGIAGNSVRIAWGRPGSLRVREVLTESIRQRSRRRDFGRTELTPLADRTEPDLLCPEGVPVPEAAPRPEAVPKAERAQFCPPVLKGA